MSTTTKVDTLKEVLSKADLNEIADALRKVDLGNMLTVKEWDSGTISAAAAVTLPEKALLVQSARIVTSGTAASVGSYLVADSAATPIIAGATGNTGTPGVASLDAAGQVLTFPNTVTRVVVRYIPAPAVALTTKFAS